MHGKGPLSPESFENRADLEQGFAQALLAVLIKGSEKGTIGTTEKTERND